MSTGSAEETTVISVARLRELEAFKEKADKRLEQLQQLAESPEKKRERMKRYIDKDREAYNAKQREYRKRAKEKAAAAGISPECD